MGAAYSRQSYGSRKGEMQPNPVFSERITVALQEYQEEEAVGCRKLLERVYRKLMLEELLLVLLGSETSFLWRPLKVVSISVPSNYVCETPLQSRQTDLAC